MKKLSSPIDLISKSFNIFFEKKNLTTFIKIYLPLAPVVLLSRFITDNYTKSSTSLSLIYLIYSVVAFIIYYWIYAAELILIKKITESKEIEIREIYKKSWKVCGSLILLSVLTGLIVVGGSILLIIPGIIFWVWYSFSTYILVENELGIKESLKASKKLVEGKFWPVFGRILFFTVFANLFQMVLNLIPFKLGPIVSSLFGALFILPYYFLYKELKSLS